MIVRAYIDAGSGSYVLAAFMLVFSLIPALVPIVIALVRHTSNRKAVIWVAVLTTWTVVGWIVAIVMAAAGKPEPRVDTVPAMMAGWHDDPESPDRLRYYDGAAWTDRTADKSPSA